METKRPAFSEKMTVHEFKKYYWYKEELRHICKKYKLSTSGTKYELSTYIDKFLSGEPRNCIKPMRPIRKYGNIKAIEMSPKTKVLESGFCLNKEARKFFCSYFKVKKFSFTKPMGIKMRQIEAERNTEATIQDLINVYKDNSIINSSKEESTYEWNKFVKDFSKDKQTKKYRNSIKIASILWNEVKKSNLPKVYSPDLFEKYHKKISLVQKESNRG